MYLQFIAWLKDKYETVEGLKEAWNCDGQHVDLGGKGGAAQEWATWDDVQNGLDTDVATKDYKHYCDLMKFRAETFIDSAIKSKVETQKLTNPNVPVRRWRNGYLLTVRFTWH